MAYSSITLTFTGVPNINDFINIREQTLGLNLYENFVESRLYTGQVTIPTFSPDDGIHPDRYFGFISTNYKNAFNLDHNATSRFTVTSTNDAVNTGTGTVTITANYPNAFFEVIYNYAPVSVAIVNQAVIPNFSISNVEFSTEVGDEASRCKVNITTNHLATKLLQPFVVNPNTQNPIVFSSYRGSSFTVEVEDSNGLRASQVITMPAYLYIDNFTLDINNSPNGATVVVTNVNSSGLVLQYSLDNITWQSSNIFTGLEAGIYNFWVKDQLGDMKSKSFSVTDVGIYTPYFYISKSNSFRFANRITFGDSANYKNDENTLSCEVDTKIAHKEVQQFQSADIITTQFKSNYETPVVKIVKSDLTEVNVPVVKMTNNIGIKDKRDAMQYNLGGDKTGIYFVSGNKYNYDTNAIEEQYSLNGLLPEWGQIGNYIQIGAAWYLIDEVVYDETKNAEVIVISNTYTGAETSIVVGSKYNRFGYEVYEFTIDMVDYIDQYFRVRINNTDSNFPEIIYLSEEIWCKVKHDRVLEIKYRNSTNTDIFYSTGITNLIRLPYTYIKGKVDEDSEIHKTDTNTILLNADVYEVDDIVFEPVTKEMWRKLIQALSHENVTINGVGYVKNGNFNTEGPLEESNLYVLTATMMKTGNVYNSKNSGSLDFNSSFIEVPGLIATENGFVSY